MYAARAGTNSRDCANSTKMKQALVITFIREVTKYDLCIVIGNMKWSRGTVTCGVRFVLVRGVSRLRLRECMVTRTAVESIQYHLLGARLHFSASKNIFATLLVAGSPRCMVIR